MENEALASIIALIVAYFLGSIPAAYLAGRWRKGIDIRQVGTHNMGAMNSFYSLGFLTGLGVLATDIGKGAAALALARWLGSPEWVVLLSGAIAIAGHSFPIWLKFHGGKGGATLIGIFIFLMPWMVAICFPIFLLMLLITRFPTLSYSIGLAAVPFVAWLIYEDGGLVIYSIVMLMLPLLQYIGRMKEIRRKSGNWRHAFMRKNIKDRM